MITHIKINGFKSFNHFEMAFTPFTVVAGTNASGKSNLFDALQLLSRLCETEMVTAFSEQRGTPEELFTKYGDGWYAREMSFIVDMLVNRDVKDNWGGDAELNNTRLRYILKIERKSSENKEDLIVTHESLEKINSDEDSWIKNFSNEHVKHLVKTLRAGGSKKPFIETIEQNGTVTIKVRQDGKQGGKATPANTVSQTVLSGINTVEFPHAFAAKEEMRRWKFLQLNPEYLREPTRQEMGYRDTITSGGKNLAAALYRIKQTDSYCLKEISRNINNFLPNFTEVDVIDDKAYRQFIIKVKDENGAEFTSRVLSEGTLRLLALCILMNDERHNSLLCYEEPENGIHPFRMKAMVKLLTDLSSDFSRQDSLLRQVIVNTHSPVLINEVAKNWKNNTNNNISIWFSKSNSLITEIDGKRIKIKISKISPVIEARSDPQLSLFPVTEQERKLTLEEVINYLDTADPESAKKAINE